MSVFVIEKPCPLQAYREACRLLLELGVRKSDMNEVQDILLSFPVTSKNWKTLSGFISRIRSCDAFEYGDQKSTRAYVREQGNITKPSYIGRMKNYDFFRQQSNNIEPINQFELVLDNFEKTPQASNFSIAVFHPTDLRDQFRPGYVPCLSMVDVKYRHGNLATKYLFRSCNLGEVGVYDLFHCLSLHRELADGMKSRRPDLDFTDQRAILFFSRGFAYKRFFSQVEKLMGEIDSHLDFSALRSSALS